MNTDPSMSELFPGDTLQCDGGLYMVESCGTKTADCQPVGKSGKPREVDNPFPKAQIIERGGQAALDKLKGLRAMKKGFVRLELGDRLCLKGKVCTVVEVKSEKVVLVGSMDGDEWSEDRVVNEFLMTDCITSVVTRLSEGQRVENLKQFLAQRKQPPVREVVETSGDKPMEETETGNMSKKIKVKKVKAVRKPKVAKTNTGNGSNGRLGKICGFSIGSVINRLGAEGVRTAEACRILEGQKVEVKKQTVAWNINEGSHGRGRAAELTKDQIKELKASAPETVETAASA